MPLEHAVNGSGDTPDVLASGGANGAGDPGAGGGPSPGSSAPAGSFTSLAEYLRAKEYDVPDGVDDDVILERMSQWAERSSLIPDDVDPQEFVQLAQWGAEHAPYQAQIAEWRKGLEATQRQPQQQNPPPGNQGQQGGAQQQAAVQQQAAAEGIDRQALELMRARCRFDERTQQYVPLHIMDVESARKLNELRARSQQNLEHFGVDPRAYFQKEFMPTIEERVNALVEERMRAVQPQLQRFSQWEEAQIQEQYLRQRDAEYVQRDDKGEFVDVTPKGAAFRDAFQALDPNVPLQQRLEYASLKADQWELQQMRNPQAPGAAGAQQFNLRKKAAAPPAGEHPPVQTPPPPTPAQKRQRFVDRARDAKGQFAPEGDRSGAQRQADRNGHAPEKGMRFREMVELAKTQAN